MASAAEGTWVPDRRLRPLLLLAVRAWLPAERAPEACGLVADYARALTPAERRAVAKRLNDHPPAEATGPGAAAWRRAARAIADPPAEDRPARHGLGSAAMAAREAMGPEEVEFGAAMAAARRRAGGAQPSGPEVLAVARALGYRKVAPPRPVLRPLAQGLLFPEPEGEWPDGGGESPRRAAVRAGAAGPAGDLP
jgi:hypothetical protein